MDTKKAIEFVKDEVIYADDNHNEDIIKKRDDVIDLLQRGEKNGKIVRDIKNIFEIRKDRRGGEWTGNNILLNIKDIQQKYFPKDEAVK